MAKDFNSTLVFQCDVGQDAEITNLFKQLQEHWEGLDVLVHSIAYAPADQLEGDYLSCVTREGFQVAHESVVTALPL